MRFFLLIAVTFGRTLIAAETDSCGSFDTHQNTDFDQRISYREYYKQSGVRPKTDPSKVVLKTCAAVGVAALTFGAVATVNLFDPKAPYKAAAAGAAAGIITFCCLSFGEK